jgi:NodT family efflux transporter outer membrane factor (OMF) lipoprotein
MSRHALSCPPLLATSLALALLTAGCTSPTPLPPPDTTAADAPYRRAPADAALDAATWRGFGDPVLQALVARASAANLDVRIAAERVRQARAGAAAAASRRAPAVALTGSLSDERSGLPEPLRRGAPDTRAARLAMELGWEIDLAGAARAAEQGAALDALAAESGVAVAQWLASTEVARQYFVWQGARLRLAQLQALLQAQQATERLTRRRESEGLASAFDVARAAGEAQALAAQLPPLHALVAVSEHQIDVLLGVGPAGQGARWRDAAAPHLPAVPRLAPGQPAALLQRRPDLQVAGHQLRAEAARLRESEADLWPKFFLATVLGRQDLRLNALDLSPVSYGSVALAFTAPLFNAGRLRAAVQRQSARAREATLRYERAVLGALQDVENSLVAMAQERARGQALAAVVDSRRTGLGHAESLHREGQIDLLQLLDAQRALIAAELAHSDSRMQQALAAVQLVQALGGGWHAEPATAPAAPWVPASWQAPPMR